MTKVFVADLINDNLDIHNKGVSVAPFSSFANEPPDVVDAEIAARRSELADLEKEFKDDPEFVVRYFRSFYKSDALSTEDVRGWIDTWKFAFDQPDEFKREVTSGQPSFGLGDWFNRLRAYLHVPPGTSSTDQKRVDEVAAKYNLDRDIVEQIKPNKAQFETLDPVWIKLALAKFKEVSHQWPKGLEAFRRHDATKTFVYPGTCTYDDTKTSRVALMADFGCGYSYSSAIARQLFKARYPYLFHLGDVYYGGTPDEFNKFFKPQLSAVVKHTQFYGLAENHELYSGGKAYLDYIDSLRNQGSTQQQGSYWCVRFDKHQLIGIDVNWNGRQRFEDPGLRQWLAGVLADGGDRTNILLTGSAPYCYGEMGFSLLMGHLFEFYKDGKIHAWLWGDDHYCALFPRDKVKAPFIGSCIGHAGFPGDKQRPNARTWATPLWVETGARFPAWSKLRQDRGNAGWVEMNLRADGGIELLYVDWLGAKRFFVTLARDNERLIPIAPREFPGREDAMPELHVP